MCDVGQGDAILIQQSFLQVVVDGGPGSRVLDCFRKNVPFWDRKIELMIMTHPDYDHSSGLVELAKRYDVEMFVSNGHPGSTPEYLELIHFMTNQDVDMVFAKKGTNINLGDLRFTFLWPNREGVLAKSYHNQSDSVKSMIQELESSKKSKTNQLSLVFKLAYHNFSGYFVGDIGFPEEKALINSNLIGSAYVLKVGHHGSRYSSSKEFVNQIEPHLSIIGVGRRNTHGHPHPDVIETLQAVDSQILRTDLHGHLIIETDGYAVQTKTQF